MKIIITNKSDINILENLEDGQASTLSTGHQVAINANHDLFVWNENQWELLEVEIDLDDNTQNSIQESSQDSDQNLENHSNEHDYYKISESNNSENFENLTFDSVTFTYPKNESPSLDNVSFTINRGEFHAFVGENGSGKSTSIKIIIGENQGYDGVVSINGKNITKHEFCKKNLSYVSDTIKFPAYLSVYKYLYNVGLMHYKDTDMLDSDIDFYLKKFNIESVKKSNPNKLSLGQQKKINLIRCLLERSEIIILDEPAANLDPTTKLQFLEILKQVQEAGVTIFISTHLLDEVKNFCTALTLISEGRILYSGQIDPENFEKITLDFFNNRKTMISSTEIADKVIKRGWDD